MKQKTAILNYVAYGVFAKKESYKAIGYSLLSLLSSSLLVSALFVLLVPVFLTPYYLFPDIVFIILTIPLLFVLVLASQYLIEQFGRLETLFHSLFFHTKLVEDKEKPKLLKRLFATSSIYKKWAFHIQRFVLVTLLGVGVLILLFYTFQSFITPLFYVGVEAGVEIYVGSIFTFSEVLIDSWGDVLLQVMSGYFTLVLSFHLIVLFTKLQKFMRKVLL